MIIIIDGYNLLKQVFHKVKGKLDKQRQNLIKQLGRYKTEKADGIKEIILVFDGGLQRHATREIHSGIVVIFSGQKRSADEWIKDYVEKHKEKEILLVTMDRELIESCAKYGVDKINVFDFYEIVKNTLLDDISAQFIDRNKSEDIQKYEDDSDFYMLDDRYFNDKIDSNALDLLMEQADLQFYKDESESLKESRKSKAHKLSKKEKKVYKKIKKL